MENEWKQLTRYFPKRVTAALGKTELEDVREIRLRRGRPLTLSTSGGECYLAANGKRLAKAVRLRCAHPSGGTAKRLRYHRDGLTGRCRRDGNGERR